MPIPMFRLNVNTCLKDCNQVSCLGDLLTALVTEVQNYMYLKACKC